MKIYNKRLNSNPLIVHAQGESHKTDKWLSIVDSNQLVKNLSDEITLLTFASGDIDFSLIKQLDASGVDFVNAVYINTENWKNTDKIINILKAIENIETPYILCLDAIDVLCSDDLSDLLSRFKSFDCDILYNASIINYPNICKDFEDTETNFKFLNAGAFIGNVEAIKNFYQYIIETSLEVNFSGFKNSEQIRVRSARESYSKNTIKVDTDCIIFQTLNGAKFILLNDTLVVI